MRRILFVCLGNICRSPTAEGVLGRLAEEAGLRLEIDSAGTGDWHIGKPPYGPAIDAARLRGIDLSPLRARQVGVADFDRFDLIVAMDRQNAADLEALRPAGNATPVRRMADFVPEAGPDVPDPYFTGDFDGALDLIETAAHGLLAELAGGPGAMKRG
ncbi:MAG: low molecular weight protein-tyrosine-phosphatase [Paracoccaceae bacterium]|nr:low molecular weight protein-tyrosine-phosphatase [Paracoccaceae bacterium]